MSKKTFGARAVDPLYARQQERIEATASAKAQSKTKYSCPRCGVNAWAKANVAIKCAVDDELLLIAPRANLVRK